MSELKLCPFCGGEAETLTAESMHVGYLFGIMCNDCRSRGDVYDTEAEAIAAWNTRVDYHGYEQAAIEAWESIKAWNSRAELGSEPPYDELLRCLENDWNIRASWDGLRKFWCIELTEEGVKLRDAMRGTLTAEQVSKAVYAHSIHADCADADWQAIADELNSRAERTCEMETDHDELEVIAYSHEDTWAYKCSACDWPFRYDRGIKPNYCPNCGARRVGE